MLYIYLQKLYIYIHRYKHDRKPHRVLQLAGVLGPAAHHMRAAPEGELLQLGQHPLLLPGLRVHHLLQSELHLREVGGEREERGVQQVLLPLQLLQPGGHFLIGGRGQASLLRLAAAPAPALILGSGHGPDRCPSLPCAREGSLAVRGRQLLRGHFCWGGGKIPVESSRLTTSKVCQLAVQNGLFLRRQPGSPPEKQV